MSRRKPYRWIATTLSALTIAAPGHAGSDTGVTGALASAYQTVEDGLDLLLPFDERKADWRIRLGAAFGTLPQYKGSDDYRLKVLPIIDIRYKNRLRLTQTRLTYALYKKDAWEAGPLIKYKGGRNETRGAILDGLGDISGTAEVGIFLKYRTDRMLFRSEYRRALSASQGTSFKVTLGHAIYKNGNFAMALAANMKWLNKRAMQTWFGITEQQAGTSTAGLSTFTPSAGVSEVSLDLLGRYDINEKIRVLGLARYGRLTGGAAQSPLVLDRNQITAGIALTFDF